jgi:hypothetical protein
VGSLFSDGRTGLAVSVCLSFVALVTRMQCGPLGTLAFESWLAYRGLWAIGGLAIASAMFHRLRYLFAEYV